jgi:hypothetical protein
MPSSVRYTFFAEYADNWKYFYTELSERNKVPRLFLQEIDFPP